MVSISRFCSSPSAHRINLTKTLFVLTLLLFGSWIGLIARSVTLDSSKYEHYLYVNHEVYDVRTGKKIADLVKGNDNKLVDGRLVVISGRMLYVYNGQDKPKGLPFGPNDYIAPNRRYKLSVIEGDLYRSEINYKTAAFTTPVRLTTLGVFKKLDHRLWRGDKLVLQVQGGFYHLDTKSKAINAVPGSVGRATPVLPSPHHLITSLGDGTHYDLEKNQIIPNQIAGEPFWLTEVSLVTIRCQNTREYDNRGNAFYDCYLEMFDFNKQEQIYQSLISKKYGNSYHLTPSMEEVVHFSTRAVAPGGRAIIFTMFQKPRGLIVMNFDTGQSQFVEENIEPTLAASRAGSFSKQDILFEWGDNKHLIYVKQGNLLEQGTFVYNIESGEKTKITPFVAERIIPFRSCNKLIIRASNNQLYVCDLQGKGFREFGDSRSLKVTKYTSLAKVVD